MEWVGRGSAAVSEWNGRITQMNRCHGTGYHNSRHETIEKHQGWLSTAYARRQCGSVNNNDEEIEAYSGRNAADKVAAQRSELGRYLGITCHL